MSRVIFHIDVNSAFLSWSSVEKLKNGDPVDLRTIPSIIGGNQESRHGIVLAKSIPAKAFNIQTGEPVSHALRKCPTLTIEPPNHTLYREYSQRMMNFLRTITPDIQQVSIDECYLDYTPIAGMYDSYLSLATYIRDSIREQFGFTVNVGIAPNKLLAKMASDFQKPDRTHTLFKDEIPTKMWPLPVSELFMTGKSSVEKLRRFGIFTIGELAHTDPEFLTREFKSQGVRMWEYANGIDDSPVNSAQRDVKGVGNSTTLSRDVDTASDAKQILLALCEQVASRLRKGHQLAQSITVEIRYQDFTNVSHQMQMQSPSNNAQTLHHTACQLFDDLWNGTPLRLLGVRTAKLLPDDAPVQLSLFDLGTFDQEPSSDKMKKMDSAMDAIRQKYGDGAITRGSLMPPKKN